MFNTRSHLRHSGGRLGTERGGGGGSGTSSNLALVTAGSALSGGHKDDGGGGEGLRNILQLSFNNQHYEARYIK